MTISITTQATEYPIREYGCFLSIFIVWSQELHIEEIWPFESYDEVTLDGLRKLFS